MPALRRLDVSCILPIKVSAASTGGDLPGYLQWLSERTETIVVDGSPPAVFAAHAAAWGDVVRHVAPAEDLATPIGKVGGVLTGVRLASHEHLIIADDDIRYDDASLARVHDALHTSEVVRPQNYFAP